ncbi:MAG: ROK family protein [Methylotenera sp.]|nr:ROK family protein [Oligoflexia bacterium]
MALKVLRKKKVSSRAKKLPLILAYDLGGTKVSVGVVDSAGKILAEIREPVVIEKGKAAVLNQLVLLGKNFIRDFPSIERAGIASAGPLDPEKGVLLDPTNFTSEQGSWGAVPIASILSRRLKLPVTLENDAAAAILAEHWMGAARNHDNAIILTLGTGLGIGVIANGQLVRAGQMMHPEGGHVIIGYGDRTAPCGCGNFGCAEAYLSGRNFTRRARTRFGDSELSTKDIADLARKRDPRALAAFEEYALQMASALHNFAVLYSPEIVIFTGSFAAASDLFLKQTKVHLEKLLERRRIGKDLLPKLVISCLHNNAGLLGGAYVALQSREHELKA